jgi:protein-tyrosine phosphatase
MAAALLHNKALDISDPTIIVTSSGTSAWHVGEGPHELSRKTWEAHGYQYDHSASQFNPRSFDEIDLILAMDLTNRANILNAARTDADRAKVKMLRSFDPALSHIDPTSRDGEKLQVPDPWGNEIEAYQEVFAMVERAVDGLIASL